MGTKQFKVQKTVSVQTANCSKGFKRFQTMNKGLITLDKTLTHRLKNKDLIKRDKTLIHRLELFKSPMNSLQFAMKLSFGP